MPTLTVGKVAERYGVGEHTVLGWIRKGELKALNVARDISGLRPQWRITQDALIAFEAARTPAPPAGRCCKPRKTQSASVRFYT